MSVLRRLLVSPTGCAHTPVCRRVPITAETGGWGEIPLGDITTTTAEIAAGHLVESVRPLRHTPGPMAARICPECLAAFE